MSAHHFVESFHTLHPPEDFSFVRSGVSRTKRGTRGAANIGFVVNQRFFLFLMPAAAI